MKTIRFAPIDTLFFKEARPMDGFGGSELKSLFPPPVRTLVGAFRTAYGDANKINWNDFLKGNCQAIHEVIGTKDSISPLKLRGPFVELDGQRLYPAPLHIVKLDEDIKTMTIGGEVECDLGKVRLPELPMKDSKRYSPLDEGVYITEAGLQKLLTGESICRGDLIDKSTLVTYESRIGIARDNTTRTVKEGALYQTSHIRLHQKAVIALDVDGFNEDFSGFVKLGGEGRGAHIEIGNCKEFKSTQKNKDAKNVIIVLLTPALLDDIRTLPIEGLTVVSACVGKAVREGGWSLAAGASTDAKSYIPAGSVWFCSCDDAASVVEELHGKQIGEEQEWGRGVIACGYWNDDYKGENANG